MQHDRLAVVLLGCQCNSRTQQESVVWACRQVGSGQRLWDMHSGAAGTLGLPFKATATASGSL